MSWASIKRAVEAATHSVFTEPGNVAAGTSSFAVAGVLTEAGDDQQLGDGAGYVADDAVYELRKDATTGPHTVAQFVRTGSTYGTLTLADGAQYVIVSVRETDTLIFLGLGGPQ